MPHPDRPRRCLFVSCDPPGSAVTRYRCGNFARVLRAEGWETTVVWVGDARVRVEHDVVVLHRICAVPEGKAFARAARACGAMLIYGTDDLVFDEEALKDEPGPGGERLRRYAPLHREMMAAADGVLVSTHHLAARTWALAGPTKPVWVCRNFLPDLSTRKSKTKVKKILPHAVTLAYLSGSNTHDADLVHISEPLAQVMELRPQVHFMPVGSINLPGKLAAFGDNRVHPHELVPYLELPLLLRASVDINLAPLAPEKPLNRGKSEIKLLEAAAVGVPTLASRWGGFAEANPPGDALAETADEWRDRLLHWVDHPEARKEAARTQQEWTQVHATEAAQTASVATAFAEMAALPHAIPPQPRAAMVNWPFSLRYAAKSILRR